MRVLKRGTRSVVVGRLMCAGVLCAGVLCAGVLCAACGGSQLGPETPPSEGGAAPTASANDAIASEETPHFGDGSGSALAYVGTARPSATPVGFPVPLSYALPYDVNVEALRALSDTPTADQPPFTIPEENVPQAQRLFDIFAWQTFIALNWPALGDGAPNPQLTLADSSTPRVWEYFVDAGLVYQKNGAAPTMWSKAVNRTSTKTLCLSVMA